jgi:hypothetical protein
MDINSTTEILEVFQQCRDAGEQIDLFEALAWRDEPPIEAFIEIVRKIKLEPLLALATQALGWVKDAEILERLKKSDELLEILSNLAKSGATDLIKWSAANSIVAIGFDFISVSQHLTEMPKIIVEDIREQYIHKSYLETDAINFWIYGDTFCITVETCTMEGENFLKAKKIVSEKIMQVLRRKGVRGVREVNRFFGTHLGTEWSCSVDYVVASQKISENKLLTIINTSIAKTCEVNELLCNQAYCTVNEYSETKILAIKFLRENIFMLTKFSSHNVSQAVTTITHITEEISNIMVAEVEIEEDCIDKHPFNYIRILLDDILEKKQRSITIYYSYQNCEIEKNYLERTNKIESETSEKIKVLDKDLDTIVNRLGLIETRTTSVVKSIERIKSGLSMYIFMSPIYSAFITLIIVVIWCVPAMLIMSIFRITDSIIILTIFTAVILFFLIGLVRDYLIPLNKSNKDKESLRSEALQAVKKEEYITQQIEQIRNKQGQEIKQVESLKNQALYLNGNQMKQEMKSANEHHMIKISGMIKIEELLNERAQVCEMLKKYHLQ